MGSGEDASDKAKDAARTAERSPAFRWTARIGFVVIGILHIVIGATAVSVALGGGYDNSGKADQGGAMEHIRQSAIGGLLLAAIAIALAALAVWQIADAFLSNSRKETTKWGRRLKAVGIAVVYLALASIAVIAAFGGHTDSSKTSQTLSGRLLAAPGGVFLLVLIGLVVVGIGLGFVVGGFTRSFLKELAIPQGAGKAGIEVFGVIGYIAKGVAVAATGVLFVVAAVTQDAQKAAGLDAALRSIVRLPYGPVLLCVVAAGLIVYGLFCVARARYDRM